MVLYLNTEAQSCDSFAKSEVFSVACLLEWCLSRRVKVSKERHEKSQ